MRLKQNLPYIKSFVMIGVVAFLIKLNTHDDGIPDQLTPEQQEYTVTTLEKYGCQLERVIVSIEELAAHPDEESVRFAAFTSELESFADLNNAIVSDPVFYANVESTAALHQELVELVECRLESATDTLVEEILRRREDPDFEIDEARYKAMARAVDEAFKAPFEAELNFCAPGECFWCKIKNRRAKRNRKAKTKGDMSDSTGQSSRQNPDGVGKQL